MMTDASNATTDAGGKAISLVRRLVVINLGFVALQALSAGLLMSGYARAAKVHAIVAVALQFGVLIQAVAAVVQWRRRNDLGGGRQYRAVRDCVFSGRVRLPEVVQLHVPIGVGIFGWLTRQATGWRHCGVRRD